MAGFQDLPPPDSFPDISYYSRAFHEFAAIDYDQNTTFEPQPTTPKNQLTNGTPFLGENQLDTPSSGASNDVTDSPDIYPPNIASFLPSPEYFDEALIDSCGQNSTELSPIYPQDNAFTFAPQGYPAIAQQQAQLYHGNRGYVQQGSHDGHEVRRYNGQVYNIGVAGVASSITDDLRHQVPSSPHYHSTALKVESPEGNGITGQAPLNDGSPQQNARRPGRRVKPTHAQSEEEDADDSGDDDHTDEADDGQEDEEEASDQSQATSKFQPKIKSIDQYRSILIAEEERMQILASKAKTSRGVFPTDPAGQQACIAEIMAAIHNFDGIVDKPGKNGKAAQSHNRFEKGFYHRDDIELKAWQLLIRIRDANNGERLIPKHIEDKHEDYKTFRARFNSVIRGLKQSKAMCKMMMDPAYIDRLAQAPTSEFKTKINNKKINGQRDEDNQRGRLAKKLGLDGAIDQAVMKEVGGAGSPASVPQTPSKNSEVTAAAPSTRKRKASSRLMDEGEGGDPFSGPPGNAKKQRPTPRKQSALKKNPVAPLTPNTPQISPLGVYSPINHTNSGYDTPIKFPQLMTPTSNKIPQITPARISNMSLAGTQYAVPSFLEGTTTEK